ncbi:AI-2E family transporter [Pseudonocardia humida]|uniref:AI-2E family transporter n=1 Tax=Pseudonocardia humida TaxID=2800819 RepID=A0ABT1A5M2_9PSEU|nr:AI-2E family transporter [Pseudonocardia humida]MCO1658322.1 AI-2E family transporter [Pseudonocardia humida]
MTTTERPQRGRGTAIGEGVTWLARWSLRIALVGLGLWILTWVIGSLWSIVLPLLLATLLATVLWPPTRWLRRHKFPPAAAAAAVLLGGLLVLAGLVALIVVSVAGNIDQISQSAVGGVQAIQDWLSGPPLNLQQTQLDTALNTVTQQLQSSISTISSGVLTGVSTVANGVINTLLTLVIAFFLIKDGPRFLPWVRATVGEGTGGHLVEVTRRVWKTLGDFIRTQAIVSLVDAVLIGAGLLILGVPLAIPLAVLTFLGGFVPIIGAIVAGVLGVLVALVSNGFTTALIVLAIIIAVQQLEGNVLQPMLQSRSLGLHAVVVLLAVTAGSTLYGIAGAFLAVPVAAAVAVVLRYLSERADAWVAGGPGPAVGPPLEVLGVMPAVQGAQGPEATVPGNDRGPAGPGPGDPTSDDPDPDAPDASDPDADMSLVDPGAGGHRSPDDDPHVRTDHDGRREQTTRGEGER